MRVLNINSNMIQQNSFKGIWGKETPNIADDTRITGADKRNNGNVDVIYTREYFPFKYETKSQTTDSVKGYEKTLTIPTRTFNKSFHHEPGVTYVKYEAKIMPKLSFTEHMLKKFLNNTLNLEKANVIKEELAKLKLL